MPAKNPITLPKEVTAHIQNMQDAWRPLIEDESKNLNDEKIKAFNAKQGKADYEKNPGTYLKNALMILDYFVMIIPEKAKALLGSYDMKDAGSMKVGLAMTNLLQSVTRNAGLYLDPEVKDNNQKNPAYKNPACVPRLPNFPEHKALTDKLFKKMELLELAFIDVMEHAKNTEDADKILRQAKIEKLASLEYILLAVSSKNTTTGMKLKLTPRARLPVITARLDAYAVQHQLVRNQKAVHAPAAAPHSQPLAAAHPVPHVAVVVQPHPPAGARAVPVHAATASVGSARATATVVVPGLRSVPVDESDNDEEEKSPLNVEVKKKNVAGSDELAALEDRYDAILKSSEGYSLQIAKNIQELGNKKKGKKFDKINGLNTDLKAKNKDSIKLLGQIVAQIDAEKEKLAKAEQLAREAKARAEQEASLANANEAKHAVEDKASDSVENNVNHAVAPEQRRPAYSNDVIQQLLKEIREFKSNKSQPEKEAAREEMAEVLDGKKKQGELCLDLVKNPQSLKGFFSRTKDLAKRTLHAAGEEKAISADFNNLLKEINEKRLSITFSKTCSEKSQLAKVGALNACESLLTGKYESTDQFHAELLKHNGYDAAKFTSKTKVLVEKVLHAYTVYKSAQAPVIKV